MTTKEFCTCPSCSDSELGAKVNAGWTIQFMQFTPDGKLHVVFVRDVPAAAAPVSTVTVVPMAAAPKPIVNRPLINAVIVGLDEPPRSVPLTRNGFKRGDTRKVEVPSSDPVMDEARRRGREVFNRVRSEGEAKIKNTRPHFMQGVSS